MRTSESIDKISAALVAARAAMKPVGKSGENTFDRYRYAQLLDYVQSMEDGLAAQSLAIVTETSAVESMPERKTKSGGSEYPVRVHLVGRLIHSSGQWIEVDGWGEGQDRGDKGLYKAITGARKYLLACLLGLATTDDPEATEGGGDDRPAPPAQRAVAAANGKASAKDEARRLGLKWSGVKQEDWPSVANAIVKKMGLVISGGATEDQAKAICEFITANASKNFMEVCQ